MDFAYFPTLFIHSWQQVQNVVCNFEKFWERSRSQKYGTVVENLRLEMELENIAEFYKKIFEKKGKKKNDDDISHPIQFYYFYNIRYLVKRVP